MIRFIWTDEAVAFLRLYGSELSTRKIAEILCTTRNAVIGKAWRCGIVLRDRAAAAAAAAAQSEEMRAKHSAFMKAYYAARPGLGAARAQAMNAANRAKLAAAR